MPIYSFACDCGRTAEEYLKMGSETPVWCTCGKHMRKIPCLPHTSMKEYLTPITMYSIGMEDPAEIRAFKRACPDVECSDDPEHPDYGLPICRSRHAKLQALKQANFIETN